MRRINRTLTIKPTKRRNAAMRQVKRSILLLGIFLMISSVVIRAESSNEGGLTPDVVRQIRQSFKMDTPTRALMNALTNNDIKKLALNREKYVDHDNLFNHKVKTKGITNQKSSGRCWLFAGLNIMRPKVIEKYELKEFEFSQSYLFFWDKFEKANTFLELIIETRERDPLDRELTMILKSPFPDGGLWIYVVELIEKSDD